MAIGLRPYYITVHKHQFDQKMVINEMVKKSKTPKCEMRKS